MAVVRGAVRGAEGVTGPLPAPPREAWGDLGLAAAEVEEEAGGYSVPECGAVAPIMEVYWPA